jgi:hypothetical protein
MLIVFRLKLDLYYFPAIEWTRRLVITKCVCFAALLDMNLARSAKAWNDDSLKQVSAALASELNVYVDQFNIMLLEILCQSIMSVNESKNTMLNIHVLVKNANSAS